MAVTVVVVALVVVALALVAGQLIRLRDWSKAAPPPESPDGPTPDPSAESPPGLPAGGDDDDRRPPAA